MTIHDYPEVHSLWLGTKGMGLNSVDDSEAGIRRFLERNPSTCFVAREGGRVVGAILGGHDGRRGYIYHAAVAGSERRKGTGRALVDRVVEALREEGIVKAALVVFRTNEPGNRFWDEIGFPERTDLVYRNRTISAEPVARIDT